MTIFIIYLIFCSLVASMSKRRSISGGALFILSFLLTPVIGFIIALLYPLSPELSESPGGNVRYTKQCSRCKEDINYSASICRYCGLEIAANHGSPERYNPEEIMSKYCVIKNCSSCRSMGAIDDRWTYWYCQKCAEINSN